MFLEYFYDTLEFIIIYMYNCKVLQKNKKHNN